MSFIQTDRHADGVVVIKIDRPPMNALSMELLGELATVAEALHKDQSVRAVVVSGGDRVFAAGADVSEFTEDGVASRIAYTFRRALDALASIPRPVIAAINGYALGGGLELAMACDLRVAAATARLGQPEILLGVVPGAGGTQRLPRLVGPARAKEMCWSGRQVRADEALAIGLVDRVVPAEEVMSTAIEWAASFAGGASVAMGLAKRAIDEGLNGSLSSGLDVETEAFIEVFATEDAAIGIASFLEHGPGKATFRGR